MLVRIVKKLISPRAQSQQHMEDLVSVAFKLLDVAKQVRAVCGHVKYYHQNKLHVSEWDIQRLSTILEEKAFSFETKIRDEPVDIVSGEV